VHTPPEDHPARALLPRLGRMPGSRKLKYRAATITAGVAALGLLAATGGVAIAAPQRSVSSVQHQLSKNERTADQLDEQYDQIQQQVSSANARLKVVNQQIARYKKQYDSERSEVGEIAAQAYEQGSLNSTVAMLTSGNAQQILNQSSILLELSSTNNAEIKKFLEVAHQLDNAQQVAQRAHTAVMQMDKTLTKRKNHMNSLVANEKSELAQLTAAQQAAVGPGSSLGASPVHYSGPTSSEADKAVEYAYDQLGCPYVFGGTGPCNDGFDCSGLMEQAWAFAGISIPRTSEEQADLPNVSESDMQPGDILEFAGDSHVGMYVGGGMLIDAPHTGADVEKVALSGWYSENLDAVVRP
jgi:cell wall-associated NlpC family hydrolase